MKNLTKADSQRLPLHLRQTASSQSKLWRQPSDQLAVNSVDSTTRNQSRAIQQSQTISEQQQQVRIARIRRSREERLRSSKSRKLAVALALDQSSTIFQDLSNQIKPYQRRSKKQILKEESYEKSSVQEKKDCQQMQQRLIPYCDESDQENDYTDDNSFKASTFIKSQAFLTVMSTIQDQPRFTFCNTPLSIIQDNECKLVDDCQSNRNQFDEEPSLSIGPHSSKNKGRPVLPLIIQPTQSSIQKQVKRPNSTLQFPLTTKARDCMLSFNPFATLIDKERPSLQNQRSKRSLCDTDSELSYSTNKFKRITKKTILFQETLEAQDAKRIRSQSCLSSSMRQSKCLTTKSLNQRNFQQESMFSVGKFIQMDQLKEKLIERNDLNKIIQQTKQKLAQVQKAIFVSNKRQLIVMSDLEQMLKQDLMRAEKKAKLRTRQMKAEVADIESDLSDLDHCRKLLDHEFEANEESNVKLQKMIGQLKRNVQQAIRDKEKLQFEYAQSQKVRQNVKQVQKMAKEDNQKVIFEIRQTIMKQETTTKHK